MPYIGQMPILQELLMQNDVHETNEQSISIKKKGFENFPKCLILHKCEWNVSSKNRNFVLFHAKKIGGFKFEIGKMSSKTTSNHFL